MEHFSVATGLSCGIVAMPDPQTFSLYTDQIGDPSGCSDLPSNFDFDGSRINNDRVTRIHPNDGCVFCQLVRRSPVGNCRCWLSDLTYCREAFREGTVKEYQCHMGIGDMVCTIRIGNRHVANVFAGQLWTKITQRKLRVQYDDLKLKDYQVSFEEFSEARKRLHRLTEEQKGCAKELLADLGELISERATAQATLQVLRDIGREIAPVLDLREGLLSFLRQARRLVDFDTATIWLTDIGDPEHLRPVAIDWTIRKQPLSVDDYYDKKIPVTEGIAGKVFRDNNELLYRKREEIDLVPPSFEDSRQIRDLHSFAGVPMRVGDSPIGVLEVGGRTEGRFADTDLPLLDTLAAHASAFTQTVRVTTTLTDIISTRNARDLFNNVVHRVPGLVNGKGCSLFLRKEPGAGDVYLVATEGLSLHLVVPKSLSDETRVEDKAYYSPGEGLTGWVLATGRSLNLELHKDAQDRNGAVEDLSKLYEKDGLPPVNWLSKYQENVLAGEDADKRRDEVARRAWLGVPLIMDDGGVNRICGVLRISEKDGGNFTPEEQHMVEACARYICLAITTEAAEAKLQVFLEEVVTALATAIDAKDPSTEGHSQNVRTLSIEIGEQLGLSKQDLRLLGMAALLHDIGKIGIPDVILSKAGKYNRAEKAMMNMHPVLGDGILAGIHGLERIREAVLQHHERVDGKGYPHGIKGDGVSQFARIIAIADSFDAITTKRPYKDSRPYDVAFDELEKSSGYDECIAQAFITRVGRLYQLGKAIKTVKT